MLHARKLVDQLWKSPVGAGCGQIFKKALHAGMLEWYGRQFDPDEADIDRILDNFERFAKKMGPEAA